jgi:hypothetical protein
LVPQQGVNRWLAATEGFEGFHGWSAAAGF